MKNKDVEKQIKNSLSKSKQSVWQRVFENIKEPARAGELVCESGRNGHITLKKGWLFTSIVAVFAIIAITLLLILPINKGKAGYVYIDINPSIQISVSESGKVDEIIPLNEDAMVLLYGTSEADYQSKSVEDVALFVWQKAVATGYISPLNSNNALLVSGAFGSDEIDNKVNLKIKEKLQTAIKEMGIYCTVLTQIQNDNLLQSADNYGITLSKYQLIDKAVKLGAKIDENEYSKISVSEINARIKAVANDIHDALTELDDLRLAGKKAQQELLANIILDSHQKPHDFENEYEKWISEVENGFKTAWEENKSQWKDEFDGIFGPKR